MLTLDILGPTRHFGWFQDGRHEKDKIPIYCNISLLPSVMITFMSGPAIFKILSSICDIYIAGHKVLTNFIQYDSKFEMHISDIFVNLTTVSIIVFNTIHICYKFQSLLILGTYLLSAFL